MMTLIFLIMMPVYLGYFFLMTWPIWMPIFLSAGVGYRRVADYFVRRNLIRFERNLAVWNLLKDRTMIPWRSIHSSIECSCKGRQVTEWMHQFGVADSYNLKADGPSVISSSCSFPDQYDLVTNMIDVDFGINLSHMYRDASDHLRKGGTFINMECRQKLNQIGDHVKAATSNGLRLIERSDFDDQNKIDLETKTWPLGINSLECVMMVWLKA